MRRPPALRRGVLLPREVAPDHPQRRHVREQPRLGPARTPGGRGFKDVQDLLICSFVVPRGGLELGAEGGEDGELEVVAQGPGLQGERAGGGEGGRRRGGFVALAPGVLGEVAVVVERAGEGGGEQLRDERGDLDAGGDRGEEEEGRVRGEVRGALDVGEALVDARRGEDRGGGEQDADEAGAVRGGPRVVGVAVGRGGVRRKGPLLRVYRGDELVIVRVLEGDVGRRGVELVDRDEDGGQEQLVLAQPERREDAVGVERRGGRERRDRRVEGRGARRRRRRGGVGGRGGGRGGGGTGLAGGEGVVLRGVSTAIGGRTRTRSGDIPCPPRGSSTPAPASSASPPTAAPSRRPRCPPSGSARAAAPPPAS